MEQSLRPITNLWDVTENTRKCLGGIAGAKCGGDLGKLGFLTPDLTGFDQEAIDHSEGFAGFWHDVKSFFGSKETVADKLNEQVMKNMSPKEKDTFQMLREKKARRIQSQMDVLGNSSKHKCWTASGDAEFADAQHCKEHVKEMERQITEQIRSVSAPARSRSSGQPDEEVC